MHALQKNQFILIAIIAALGAGMYLFGDLTGPPKDKSTPNASNPSEHQHDPMNPSAEVAVMNIEKYSLEVEAKLSPDKLAKQRNLTEKAIAENSAVAYKDLAEFWEGERELNLAARYYKKAAFLENSEKSITFAGNLLLAIMGKTEEPSMRKWQALEAIACFEEALKVNPDNADTKIALASCYTDGTGETMKGVTLLREVTQKDSNNIAANIILGKLAIQSGQFDKAVKRLERVIALRSDNTEAMYFLAEAYKGLGDKNKAIELFEQCKRLVNKEEFSAEIDNYIKTFK